MDELITLEEAFKQQTEHKQAGKAIYIRWKSAELFAVYFAPDQPHTNRYRMILALEEDSTGQLITLPADTPVYVK